MVECTAATCIWTVCVPVLARVSTVGDSDKTTSKETTTRQDRTGQSIGRGIQVLQPTNQSAARSDFCTLRVCSREHPSLYLLYADQAMAFAKMAKK